MKKYFSILLLLGCLVHLCVMAKTNEQGGHMVFTLKSPAFSNESVIPEKYTCDGADMTPPLQWENMPEGTKSLVLIVDDPDAPVGIWDHWILYNIPPYITEFTENLQTLPEGTLEGKNSWARTGYGGPCPPDKMHRYFFKLYALDTLLDLPNGAHKSTILKEMEGHILGETQLMGQYDRRR